MPGTDIATIDAEIRQSGWVERSLALLVTLATWRVLPVRWAYAIGMRLTLAGSQVRIGRRPWQRLDWWGPRTW